MDTLEFFAKNRSRFGLLSPAYLIIQRCSILELQMNYIERPYHIQEKISSHVQGQLFNDWYAACIDYYHNYSCDIWES